jgi:magnesium chelatase family protein
VRERVVVARERQLRRLADHPEVCNAQLTSRQIRDVGRVTASALRLLGELYDRHSLSARGHTRILRVARTVADLDGADIVGADHVAIAASLRFDDSNQLAEAA